MTLPLLITLACLPLCAGAVETPIPPEGMVLFDFETEDALADWHVRDLTEFALTREWASRGRAAAAITFHEYEAGKEQWPAVIASTARGALPVSDWSLFDTLEFDARNPQDFPATLRLHLRDGKEERFSETFSIPPRSVAALRVKVDDIAALIDAGDVLDLHFFVTRPDITYVVQVDNVRLRLDLRPKAEALLARTRALEREVARRWAPVRPDAPPLLATQVTRTRTIRGQAERLVESLRKPTPLTPRQVEAVRTRLGRIEADCDALQSLPLRLVALERATETPDAAFVLAIETSMKKVFLEFSRFESPFSDRYRFAAARNEHESFQAVVVPVQGDLYDVQWTVTPLRHASGAETPASVRLVGYVDCKQPSYPVSHTGWWPDPLIDFVPSVKHVPGDEVLPLWITASVPQDAPPGPYRGTLTVTAAGSAPQTVDITLEVWDFAVPSNTGLRTALSFRTLSPRLYPAERIPELTRKYEDWMLSEYHLNPGSIYAGGPPSWDADRLRELMDMGLSGINLGYINAPRGDEFNAEAHWRRFEQQMERIEEYLPVLDAAGARDLAYIYCFDERPTDQLDVVFETARRIRERLPDIPVMTTAYDRTFGLDRDDGHFMDIWVPLTPHFDGNAERIAEARAQGRDIWWYICIGPRNPYANWFIEYTAIEPRLIMGAMTAMYEPGGFLYYAVNRWPENDRVITGGPRTDWNPASYKNNNGDGSVMCAGPDGPLATIRLENIRDGIEDYEYYMLLRRLLQERGEPAAKGHVPPAVMRNLVTYTRDPAVLYAERERVAREILRLSR